MKRDLEVGQKVPTRTGVLEVVEINRQDVKVRFEDGYETVAKKGNVLKGSVSNPYARTMYGIGFRGEGPYKMHGQLTYSKWANIFVRCYNLEYNLEHKTYEEAYCHEDWHNYQNFCKWAYAQVGFGVKGFDLDKDILYSGNKMYGPDTCVFLPQELNKILGNTGPTRGISTRPDLNGKWVARLRTIRGEIYLGCHEKDKALAIYREAKLNYLKERAEHWKEQIDPRAYAALMDYQFKEIT